ncbi:MAG: pseudaminic acid cytidylyltransferase [Alphaproteobacteria bacterium]|nr:pseudaminic acid cytidylyltransferase [Alphaproteobacteria bacterium]
MTKPVAIIPARGGSKRLPRKNILPVMGKPMIAWPIEAALQSGVFETVIVSTEDDEIADIAKAHGAAVVKRPDDLASDTAMEIDVYAQVLASLPAAPQSFCAIYATAILLQPDDFQKSFAAFNAQPEADAMMSVSEFPIHPFKALSENSAGFLEMVHPKECLQRSQTYPRYTASNGTFYWLRTAAYNKQKTYYQPHLLPYILPASRAVDIDTLEDLKMAEAMLRINQERGAA